MNRDALRVAFNATPLLSPLTGIGNYIIELGAALASSGAVDAHSFYRGRWSREVPTPRSGGAGGGTRGLVRRIKPFVPFRGILRQAAQRMRFVRGLGKHRVELYHEQNYVPLAYDVPVVITIHDLSWIRHPDAHPPERVKWLERGLPRAIERCRAILVDSEFVKQEVMTTFGVEADRVHTAHLGVGADFHPRAREETMVALAPLGLSHGSYLLTVGTLEPRKNLRSVLDAFLMLPERLRQNFPLVVAGAEGWHSSELITRLRRLDGGQVKFLGPVDRSLLLQLYAGAALFVFPSLYEGFGLPALEAMASGAPVLVSDRASLPEVVGDAGATMNPEAPEDIAARLAALLDDPSKRREMAQRGLARATRFSWQGCADVTYGVYCSALGRPVTVSGSGTH